MLSSRRCLFISDEDAAVRSSLVVSSASLIVNKLKYGVPGNSDLHTYSHFRQTLADLMVVAGHVV